VGQPIETTGYTVENRNALIARVRSAIEALLAERPVDETAAPGVS
jgi:hypothetical protein